MFSHTVNNNVFSFNNVFGTGGAAATQGAQGTANESAEDRTRSSSRGESPSSAESRPEEVSSGAGQAERVKRRASLSDIASAADVDSLSAKQLKEILASNFVEYKGCCEKKELVDKVKRLYASSLDNKRLEEELNSGVDEAKGAGTAVSGKRTTDATAAHKKSGGVDESDLCKICMESLIDCVLLECGHMVSCTRCGKRLAECPICR